ncbi:uncharacterized protein [Dermacentor albipictus]|uniref:uncharacterized protein isoform X2 n=1 Tax=Dermacentor albipictus TaxID=60249 RepID=UPI0031FD62B5
MQAGMGSESQLEDKVHMEGHIADQGRRILREHRFPPSWRVAWLAQFCHGFTVTVDNVMRKQLEADSRYGPAIAEAVVDIKEVGGIMGVVIGSILVQAAGRIMGLHVYGVGTILGTLATVLSPQLPALPALPTWFLICAFQAVSGVFIAVGNMSAHVYLTEVAPDEDRGAVVGIQHCFYLAGRLVAVVFPHRLPWQWFAVISLLPYVWLVIVTGLIVESPRWLLQVNRPTDAQRAYEVLGIALSGDECAILAIRTQRLQTPLRAVVCFIFVYWMRMLGGPMGMQKYQDLQLVGVRDTFYGLNDVVMVIFQIAIMPGVIFLADAIGRRFLLYISSMLIAVILPVSAYLVHRIKLAETLVENAIYERAIMCAALCSVVAYSVGLGPVSILVCTEILPPRRHGLVAGLLYAVVRTLFFALRWSLRSGSSQVWYFVTTGATAWLSLVVLMCLLPETKQMALDKVPNLFSDDPWVRAAAAVASQEAGGTHALALAKATRQFPLRDFADTYAPAAAQEESDTSSSQPE